MPVEYALEEWLTEAYDYEPPHRGQIRQGEILKIEEQGVTIDLGLKRDGFVPYRDLERLGEEASSQLELGQEVVARVVRREDREGNLILSLYQARSEKDWKKAQSLLENGDVWQGKVAEYNRGGLIVTFGHLRGFVPASHLAARNMRGLSSNQREEKLKAYVGRELSLKVIEVNRNRRRLILSERLAIEQLREQNIGRLLDELVEGQVCRGRVSRLCDFGAFVELGGAEGLIHISELAWRRIRRPEEVLQAGDEIEVYVLRLDHQRKRIGLSLKRLQPSPWGLVDETYSVDQLVSGVVTNVVKFGAFVALDIEVEGLVHVSELADPPPSEPRDVAQVGDELVLRILRIDSFRHRIALSLKRVSAQERSEWLAQQSLDQGEQADDASDSALNDVEMPPEPVHTAEVAVPVIS
jgi:small subunit ribosomal protein S1